MIEYDVEIIRIFSAITLILGYLIDEWQIDFVQMHEFWKAL